MNPLREAAQQALGFVTSEAWGTTPYMDVRVYEDAARLRDVLQAALAQQVEPLNLADPAVQKRLASQWGYVPAAAQAEPVQEPVAWEDWWRSHGQYNFRATARMTFERAKELMKLAFEVGREAAPQPQQPEPVQEPVAWRYKPMIGSSWSLSDDGYYISCKRDKGYIVEPLYTAPPQRKLVLLTDGEIDALPWFGSPRQFARAVEKASWEKNK